MHWLLVYELAPGYLEKRNAHRAEHLALAWSCVNDGSLLLGGAVGDPVESAMLLFRDDDGSAARDFAERDPYVRNGLVVRWRVLPWTTVVGEDAAKPVGRPSASGGEDGDGRELATSRVLPHAPPDVFAAIRDGARLARWWGPRGFTNTFETFEFADGGAWRFVMHGPDGGNHFNESRFATIVPDRLVEIEHRSAPRFRLSIALMPVGSGTRVEWRQRFETARECERVRVFAVEANEQNLDRLEQELARQTDASSI